VRPNPNHLGDGPYRFNTDEDKQRWEVRDDSAWLESNALEGCDEQEGIRCIAEGGFARIVEYEPSASTGEVLR
jgi:hypothetical protein